VGSSQFISLLHANFLQSRIAKGAFWGFVGSVLSQMIGMLTSIYTARILGKVGFGELGIIRSSVLMFGSLAGFGIGLAATKYIAEFRTIDKLKTGRIIGVLNATSTTLGLSASVLCFFMSDFLSIAMFSSSDFSVMIKYASPLLFLGSYSSYQIGVISGFEKFKALSLIMLVDSVLLLLFIGLGTYYYRVSGALIGTVISSILGVFVKGFYLVKVYRIHEISITHKSYKSEIFNLMKFVLPTILFGVALQPFEWFSRVLLSRQNHGTAELGIFLVAFTWSQLVMFLPLQLTGSLGSVLPNLLANGDVKQVKRAIKKSFILIFIFAILTALVLFAISNFILRSYGSDFANGKISLYVMIATYSVAAITVLFRSILIILNKPWIQFIHTIILGFLLVAGTYFFIRNGSLGLSQAYFVSHSIFTIIQFITVFTMLRKMQ
jgi:O-antigen/teichoic acid export membrane protein